MRNRWVAAIAVLVLLGVVTAWLLGGRRAREDTQTAVDLGAGPAGATSTTAAPRVRSFVAVADAKVDAANPTRDFGSSDTLRVDADPVIRSYLRFKVGRLTGAMGSATLRVWANSRQQQGYRVRRLGTTAWSEATITFASQPAGAAHASPLGSSGPVRAGSWTSVEVTPLLAGGNGTHSLVLETTGATGLSLASREDAPHAPRLIVTTG